MNIVVRIKYLAPSWLLAVAAVNATASCADTVVRRSLRVIVSFAGFGVLCAIMFKPAATLRMKLFEYGTHITPRFEYIYMHTPDAFRELHGKTVLSDSWTSYLTKYALQFNCVTTPEGHTSPSIDTRQRSAVAGRFFSADMTKNEARTFLEEYDCEYVLFNRRLSERRSIMHFEFGAQEYSSVDPGFAKLYSFLEEVYATEDVTLYRIRSGTAPSEEK